MRLKAINRDGVPAASGLHREELLATGQHLVGATGQHLVGATGQHLVGALTTRRGYNTTPPDIHEPDREQAGRNQGRGLGIRQRPGGERGLMLEEVVEE
jgi:hypothetical protein